MRIFHRLEENGQFNDHDMFGQSFFSLRFKGKEIVRFYPISNVSSDTLLEDSHIHVAKRQSELKRLVKCQHVLARSANRYQMFGAIVNDNRKGIEQGLKSEQDCKDFDYRSNLDNINRISSGKTIVYRSSERGKKIERKQKPSLSNMVDFYMTKSEYIRKKQYYKAPVNTEQDELLSLSLSDMVIKILEHDTYVTANDIDKAMGIDFIHYTDLPVSHKVYSNCITDLSKNWRASKRPDPKKAITSLVDDESNTIDIFDVLAKNYDTANVYNGIYSDIRKAIAKQDKEGDLYRVFDLFMQGYDKTEISKIIGRSRMTVHRLMDRIYSIVEPFAYDLACEVIRRDNSPDYSW